MQSHYALRSHIYFRHAALDRFTDELEQLHLTEGYNSSIVGPLARRSRARCPPRTLKRRLKRLRPHTTRGYRNANCPRNDFRSLPVGGDLRAGDGKGKSHIRVDNRSGDARQGPHTAGTGPKKLCRWRVVMIGLNERLHLTPPVQAQGNIPSGGPSSTTEIRALARTRMRGLGNLALELWFEDETNLRHWYSNVGNFDGTEPSPAILNVTVS